MSGTPLHPAIAEPSCLYLEEQQKHERGKNVSACRAKDDSRQRKPGKEACHSSCFQFNHLAPNDYFPAVLHFAHAFCCFPRSMFLSRTPEVGLRTINVPTPGAATTSARCSFLPSFLTCTMFPQFPLVLLIWKEIKSSPSMPVHCLSLIRTPSLSKPSWKSLHLDMDTSIWAALQVTSASMMSWESVGKQSLWKARQWELVLPCGWARRPILFRRGWWSSHTGCSISNEALIKLNEYMNSFEAITWAMLGPFFFFFGHAVRHVGS